jgi:hypothetical protein
MSVDVQADVLSAIFFFLAGGFATLAFKGCAYIKRTKSVLDKHPRHCQNPFVPDRSDRSKSISLKG